MSKYPWRPEEGVQFLELDLQRVVRCHVCARDQTQVLCKSRLTHWATFSPVLVLLESIPFSACLGLHNCCLFHNQGKPQRQEGATWDEGISLPGLHKAHPHCPVWGHGAQEASFGATLLCSVSFCGFSVHLHPWGFLVHPTRV